MKKYILAIDVGNTNTVFGIFENNNLLYNWRMATTISSTSDEIRLFILNMMSLNNLSPDDIDGIIISSVVPTIMHSLENAVKKHFDKSPIIVNNKLDFGLEITLDNPSEIGADRLVNAAAAVKLYGGPLIVVDFGTATTFCAITEDRKYLGGAICPGVKISLNALYQNTAKLPRIEITKPDNVIGNNTINAMQSGVFFSYVGGVDHIVSLMKETLGDNTKTIATGGLSSLIAKSSKTIDVVDKNLTLKGLNIIYNNISA